MEQQPLYLPNAYKCIAIWGRTLGSFPSYISNEQRKASEAGAPLTAIYQRRGVWVVAEDIENTVLKNEILTKLARLAAGV